MVTYRQRPTTEEGMAHIPDRTYTLPCHDFGSLTGVTIHQEQRACRTIADKATDYKDATLILEMIGVWPDKEYQHYLREK